MRSWNHIQGIVKRFHRQTERKFDEINKQLGIIAASTTILERELRDRWNLKSKLRIHSYYKAARSPSTAAM
jgi:hypothetical protein